MPFAAPCETLPSGGAYTAPLEYLINCRVGAKGLCRIYL